MSKPVRQHFIPRSYLNNFAEIDGDKHFVFAKRKGHELIRKYSTKDICVEKNLYTLPVDDDNKKFDLEHFYADRIDSVYPEVYRFLIDKQNTVIDFEMRLKVISVCLSLYFRTPKFLNIENDAFERIFEQIKNDTENVKVVIFGKEIVISKEEAKKIIREKKEDNRRYFLRQHLIDYEKFVSCKLLDNMAVYHIADENEFITSDNPVVLRPFVDVTSPDYSLEVYYSREIDPFDPKNMICISLDAKTILVILPSEDNKVVNTFLQQSDISFFDVLMYNSEIEKFSEQWIVGSDKGVQSHVSDQVKYNKDTPENRKLLGDYQKKTIKLLELQKKIEKYGLDSDEVKFEVVQLRELDYMANDNAFRRLASIVEGNRSRNL
ncbi:DUF4238 domain-containing protein [Chryseobacterium sp.]|uniref:DUF4238 domain-containing protein n=1 Tax=Chryseobacterium sp. TaxID=1871047 RepID=UPI0031E014B8